jgi:hypothetical protein
VGRGNDSNFISGVFILGKQLPKVRKRRMISKLTPIKLLLQLLPPFN